MAYDRVVQSGISTNRVGVANMQRLTLMEELPILHESPGEEMAAQEGKPVGSPHLWLAALLVLVAALWIVNQHVRFGPLNLLFILLAVIAGIVVLKALAARYYVPGLSPVILAS